MDTQTLARARAGDQAAFGELVEPHRREIQLHCYRILGSLQDAQDVLQETLLAAWRGLDGFQERATLRSWLYRIATNRCLNALRDRGRRPPALGSMIEPPEPSRRSEPLWLEPYPDVLLDGIPEAAPGPDARYETAEAVGLAFVAALQRLPPRQRVVLVLRDVLGFTRAEVAAMLGTSEAAVKAGLQRARATLEAGRPTAEAAPRSPRELAVIGRFVGALENGDIDAVIALLTDDAWLTMPPEPYEYQGHAAIAGFLRYRAPLLGGRLRLVPTGANGQPAFGCYLPDPQAGILRGYGMVVLAVEAGLVSRMTWFGDRSLFPPSGFPAHSATDRAVLAAVIPDRLEAHLRAWLGRWPGSAGGLTVVGSPARDEPGWDGGLHRVIGVTAPGHGVLSVPPPVASAVAAWLDGGGSAARIPDVAGLQGAWFDGVFRWSDRPAPLPDAGEWLPAGHPSVPPWLRRFGGEVLVVVDDVTGEHLAGVGMKEHDVHGRELAVVTVEAARGRGLARRLVARAARRVLDEGGVPTYVHARANAASARVAAAAGFPDRGWSFLAVDPR